MHVVLLCLAILLIVATALPFSHNSTWWIRVLDFPRMQLAFLSGLVFVLLFVSQSESSGFSISVGLLVLGSAVYQLAWIYPYLPIAKNEVPMTSRAKCKGSITLLTANVLQTNSNKQGLLDLIRECNPDVVVTLETDKKWEASLATIEAEYIYNIKCPLDNLYGMHVYSKLELVNSEVSYLIDKEIPSIHCEILLENELPVQAHFLHPEPPVPQYSETTDGRDAELIVVAKSIRNSSGPCLVAGDLNDVAWSTTTRLFRKISGLLDPRIGRGVFNTFHAEIPFLRWPLDHVFHSSHFSVIRIERLRKFGSDHFPLLIELGVSCGSTDENSGLEAMPQDEALAKEKVGKKNVSVDDVPGDK